MDVKKFFYILTAFFFFVALIFAVRRKEFESTTFFTLFTGTFITGIILTILG